MITREFCCIIVVGISASAFWKCSELYAQHTPTPEAAKDVNSVLPGPVAKLVSWPDEKQRAGKVVQFDVSRKALWAKRSSIEWIQKVIDPQWLPESPEETLGSKLVLLKDVYDGLDTSHVEWEKNGYCFRVSQTMTVFYLSLMPTQGKIAEDDVAAKRKASREIASKVINNIVEVKAPLRNGEVNIAAGGTKPILIGNSFETANVEQFIDGIVAQPATIDFKDQSDRARWSFWWRRVGWWTNGKTLGLFTLKTEGGAWRASYSNTLDKEWFSRPSSKSGQ